MLIVDKELLMDDTHDLDLDLVSTSAKKEGRSITKPII